NPERSPTCPKCGNKRLTKQMSGFATPRGAKEPSASGPDDGGDASPDFEDPRMLRAMGELERDMEHMDENNPKHMAHMMKKMKDIMPAGTVLRELDVTIKRLEAGEDPARIEQKMSDLLGDFMDG